MFGIRWRKLLGVALLAEEDALPTTGAFFADRLRFPELARVGTDQNAELQPYQGLADLWHAYTTLIPTYKLNYLNLIARYGGAKISSILDLACGTGSLTAELIPNISTVVGLDLSPAMLAKARLHCANLPADNLIEADFRDFHLGRQFDLVVCAFNSINYVSNADELKSVFRCVAEHLKPGGHFLFDTTTSSGLRKLSRRYFHVSTAQGRFVIHYEFDRKKRETRNIVLTPGGPEIHRRIAIDLRDVIGACATSGLHLHAHHPNTRFPSRWYVGPSCYFVAKKK